MRTCWIVAVVCIALGRGSQPLAQGDVPFEAKSAPSAPEVRPTLALEGFVLGPHGAPVEGAVVTSSAGGRAVADAAGSYRLEVEVSSEATSLQVSALGAAGLAASASVALGGTSRVVPVVPLQLALGASCSPSWLPTFGGEPPVGDASAAVEFDDGSGPALHVGLRPSGLAKWDGVTWSPLADPFFGKVNALAVHDDGGGPALYVGGSFLGAGANIAKWDGSSWSALGSGMNNEVFALAVYDDGGGPALYAGGTFIVAGGVAASRIAKWDGTSWSAVGGGTSTSVLSLAVYDDGSGPALHAGGTFTSAGGVSANRVARWDGASWSALGSGTDNTILALAVHDEGSGPALYCGGWFTSAGGVAASRIARWDGSSWSALGSGMNDTVHALMDSRDAAGPTLYAGGAFTTAGGTPASRIARWDGSGWTALGAGLTGASATVQALAEYGDCPRRIYAGGTSFGGTNGVDLKTFDGSTWLAVGNNLDPDRYVNALMVHDDGGGPALFAGGGFRTAGGLPAHKVAKWDGARWSALGAGVGHAGNGDVYALIGHDDGSGPALFVGGSFTTPGIGANNIAKWDGSSWSALGSGIGGTSGRVKSLAVFDDGSGPALHAGGTFTTAGGLPANRIARWDGASWSALGSGMNDRVNAVAVFDDGTGPALYAGGSFTLADGNEALRIARWNGSSWSSLGSGMSHDVWALEVFDDGSGAALYAAGSFITAGGVSALNVARWDGSNWSALGSNGPFDGSVLALTSFDGLGGPALYAGGIFETAGGVAANWIARWDGSSWSALGTGLAGDLDNRGVFALAGFDDGMGPALYAGGEILTAGGLREERIARWGCADTAAPVLSCPASIQVIDGLLDGPGEVVTFAVTADDLDPSLCIVCVPPSGSTFPRGTTLVECTATDRSGNSSTCQFQVTVQSKAVRRAF